MNVVVVTGVLLAAADRADTDHLACAQVGCPRGAWHQPTSRSRQQQLELAVSHSRFIAAVTAGIAFAGFAGNSPACASVSDAAVPRSRLADA